MSWINKQSILSIPKNIKYTFYNLYDELTRGPGAKNLSSIVRSPLGLMIGFFVFLAMMLPSIPGTISVVNQLWYILFYLSIAQSWNIIGGYGGEVDFGHVFFVGIGIYTVAILNSFHNVNVWLAVLIAGFTASIIAILVGLPILRLKGAYFAITMLAVAEAAGVIFTYFSDFTGGGNGVYIGGLISKYDDLRKLSYYAILIVALFSIIVTYYISYSRLGLSLRAIKESPEGAAASGVNVLKTKVQAFAISGFIAGIAGGVFMIRILNVTPLEAFSVQFTVEMIIISLLGGPGSVIGPVLGAVLLTPMRTWLIRNLSSFKSPWIEERLASIGLAFRIEVGYLLVYGLVFILAVLFLPKGIIGYLQDKGIIGRESLVKVEEDNE